MLQLDWMDVEQARNARWPDICAVKPDTAGSQGVFIDCVMEVFACLRARCRQSRKNGYVDETMFGLGRSTLAAPDVVTASAQGLAATSLSVDGAFGSPYAPFLALFSAHLLNL